MTTTHSVLLIDDEAAIRLALRRWFERRGWGVAEAPDGDVACEILAERHGDFSLVICDLHLPGLNGEEIAQRVTQKWPALLPRFVFSSGDALEHAAEGSILRSHTLLLPKPFEYAELRAIIERVVGADALA